MRINPLVLFILLLLIFIPNCVAYNNESNLLYEDDLTDTNIESNDYQNYSDVYFDADCLDDKGNGSKDNPYKKLTSSRIVNNSIIHLTNGEYNFTSRKSFTNISFIGESKEDTFIYGGIFIANGFFSAENLTFNNFNITNNYRLNIANVIFMNTTNRSLHGNNSNITLDNCSFINCSNTNGGALYVKNSTVNIINSNFSGNNASTGGAICSIDSNLIINTTVFYNNTASTMGGALSLLNTTCIISNSTFVNNSADYYAGAMYLFCGVSAVDNSLFEYNSALIASCIYSDNINPLEIRANSFYYNRAQKSATVYIVSGDENNIENNLFENNIYLTSDIIEDENPDTDFKSSNITLFSYILSNTSILPEKYDLREFNQITGVKNQLSDGNCWAFAALASLESCILKASNISYDLSENNMKNLMALYSDYGWNYEPNNGGNYVMSNAYLTSWLGPVLEEDDTYTSGSILSPVLSSIIHIQNILFIKRENYTDNNAIKNALVNYGAVASSIYWDFSCSNGSNYYFNGTNSSNHAVTIIGWDDTYSRYNFKTTPEGDGAWIIKNSWGTSSYNDGYYYISYYDTTHTLQDYSITYILNDSILFDNNYQYDIAGCTDYFLNNSNTVYYKNTYQAKNDEYLEAVSTYFNDLTNYSIKVYVNDNLVCCQNGSSSYGYYTIMLDKAISLEKYDNFTVEFKITTQNDAGVPISENITTNRYYYKENVSFISYDGVNWHDLSNLTWQYTNHIYYSQTASIKAFSINKTAYVDLEICNSTVKVYVYDQLNTSVTGGLVTVNINDNILTFNNSNGSIIIDKILSPGKNTVTAVFTKEDMNSCNKTMNITLKRESTVNINTTITGTKLIITAYILDSENNSVDKGKVVFKIDGKTLKDENGKVIYVAVNNSTATLEYSIPEKWNNKTLNITVVYSGCTYILASRNYTQTRIEIIEEASISIIEPKDEINTNTTVRLKALTTGITNAKVVFKLNGKTLKDANGKIIYLTLDENGFAILAYNFGKLKAGNYTITAVLLANNKKIQTDTVISIV